MSIVDKMLKWWDSGLQALAPPKKTWAPPRPPRKYEEPIMKTWIIVFLNSPNQTVTAARMDNSGGAITFYVGDKAIAQFQSAEVVGVEEKS